MFEGARVLAILNPSSGRGEATGLLNTLEGELRAHGATDAEVRVTEGPDDAFDWAKAAGDDGFQVVVAGGGDGTVTAVAHGVMRSGRRLPIGILPLGTGNGMARVLGLPLEPNETLAALAAGKVVDVDVAKVVSHDAISLLFFGAGLDADINRDADAEEKSRLGFLAYLKAAASNLRRTRNHDLSLDLDGEERRLKAHTVSVFNATRVDLLGVTVGPDAQPHDGVLSVTIMNSARLLASLAQLFRLAGKSSSREELVTVRRLRVDARPPLRVQVDGDVVGETPLEAEIAPAALRFIADDGYAANGDDSESR